jgi:hypothetical protein
VSGHSDSTLNFGNDDICQQDIGAEHALIQRDRKRFALSVTDNRSGKNPEAQWLTMAKHEILSVRQTMIPITNEINYVMPTIAASEVLSLRQTMIKSNVNHCVMLAMPKIGALSVR